MKVQVLSRAPKQYADLFGRLVVLSQKDLNRRGVVPVALRVGASLENLFSKQATILKSFLAHQFDLGLISL
ncbi:hypothetical protein EB118_06260 [bacterium]|nr:hypothetical protein [bacterium]NDC94357.1 hypothetical protein [bacterium]NDD83829.1 hypothetical protein [bacterium]NDG29682.1 hypothetical protein [bacterium]